MNLKDTSPDAMRKLREELRASQYSTVAAAIWADIREREMIADGAQSNPWSKDEVERAFREGVAWADMQRNKTAAPLPLDSDSPMTGAMLAQSYFSRYTELVNAGGEFPGWSSLTPHAQLAWNYLANIIQRTRNAALESMTEQRNKLREELGQVRADFHQINSEKAVMHTEINQLKRDLRDAREGVQFAPSDDLRMETLPPTIHDRYTMAALTGLLAGSKAPVLFDTAEMIEHAIAYASEAMKQRLT